MTNRAERSDLEALVRRLEARLALDRIISEEVKGRSPHLVSTASMMLASSEMQLAEARSELADFDGAALHAVSEPMQSLGAMLHLASTAMFQGDVGAPDPGSNAVAP